eukprot:TRINITY_DN31351_c0_g1_i1.p1 TRINITY_DN31351_c0_g1~~TRINITY_DN31351_c0_g1_i1.p1  ORF type:complete len:339 (-),score=33.42 TRINITY_DN31351_c0_g1_i1:449-1465(-)
MPRLNRAWFQTPLSPGSMQAQRQRSRHFLLLIAAVATISVVGDPARFTTLGFASPICSGFWIEQSPLRSRRGHAVARHGKPTYGNSVRESDVTYEPPALPADVADRLDKLLKSIAANYQTPRFNKQQFKIEFERYFRPHAANQAWEEINPRAVARLLQDADLKSHHSFVDAGSGLGKLVVMAAAVTSASVLWGIELSPKRAQEATRGVDALVAKGAVSAADRARIRLLQGSCSRDLPEEALAATHFMLTMRHLGKLPAGQRHPSEVLVDKLARTASSVPDEPRTIWSVGKRLENRDGLEARRTSWLSAEWADGESVLVHEYSLQPPSAVKDEMSFAGF